MTLTVLCGRYLEEKRDHQLKPDKTSLSSLTSSITSLAPKPVPAPNPGKFLNVAELELSDIFHLVNFGALEL